MSQVLLHDEEVAPSIPNLLNAAIVLAQLCAIAFLISLTPVVEGTIQIVLLGFAFGVVMNSVYSTIHEAYHRMLFSNPWWNEATGIVMALFFPASFHLLRQGHLGHHARNRSDDEVFDLYFDEDSLLWKVFAWYSILIGLYWVLVAASNIFIVLFPFLLNPSNYRWDRNCKAFVESFDVKLRPVMRCEAAAAILLHVSIVAFFGLPVLNYVIMYCLFGWMWSAMQYVHHYDTERDVSNGARNLYLCEPIDSIWLNHNWHLTHHRHPRIPWIYLREIARREESCRDRGFLLYHYLRMWRGPRHTSEHKENRYAGRIIR